MAFNTEHLTTLYASLPSIFENNPSIIPKTTSNVLSAIINAQQLYQPMFGSFLFPDSDPFTKAAFIAASSPSVDSVITTEQKKTDSDSALSESTASNSSDTRSSSRSSSTIIDDTTDMDDEDDFDGIPIRHDSKRLVVKELCYQDDLEKINVKLNENLLDIFSHTLREQQPNQNEDEENDSDIFLNGYTLEEEQSFNSARTPSYSLKDIPDIDDSNEHEEDDNLIPFNSIHRVDQSESLRSSSPDSLLSSSHLHDDNDDDNDDDDDNNDTTGMHHTNDNERVDVTQWNDDFILSKPMLQSDRSAARLTTSTILDLSLTNQVSFIDTSRSESRCSDASLDSTADYRDQAVVFTDDDDESISSSSDSHEQDTLNLINDASSHRSDEESSLEFNLNYVNSRLLSHRSNSIVNSFSSPSDKLAIVITDEDRHKNEPESLTSTNVVHNDYGNDLERSTINPSQPHRDSLKRLFQSKQEQRKQEIIHDIINIRHLFNEHDNDDEFIAVMHNPRIFEETLSNNACKQQSHFIEQTNDINCMNSISSRSITDNQIESVSIEPHLSEEQSSSFYTGDKQKSFTTNINTIRDNHSSLAVNHHHTDNAVEITAAKQSSGMIQERQKQSSEKIGTNVNIKQIMDYTDEGKVYGETLSSDDEFDNDTELIHTLAQLHNVVHLSRSSSTCNQTSDPKGLLNTEEILNSNCVSLLNSTKSEENNRMFSLDHGKNENQSNFYERTQQTSSTYLPLSSLIPSDFLNDDESSTDDIIVDSDASSSLFMSTNELNMSSMSTNQFKVNDSLITNTHFNTNIDNTSISIFDKDNHTMVCDDLLHRSETNMNTSFNQEYSSHAKNDDDNDFIDYLDRTTSSVNGEYLSSTGSESKNNKKFIVENNSSNRLGIESIRYDSYVHNESERDDKEKQKQQPQTKEKKTLSCLNIEHESVIDEINFKTIPFGITSADCSEQQIEQLIFDKMLSQAIDEDQNEENIFKIENHTASTNSLYETTAKREQLPDPFDKTFDSVWARSFQTPDDMINENSTDSLSSCTNTYDDTSLFATISIQDDHSEESITTSSPHIDPFDSFSKWMRCSVHDSVRSNNSSYSSTMQDDSLLNENGIPISSDEINTENHDVFQNSIANENHIDNGASPVPEDSDSYISSSETADSDTNEGEDNNNREASNRIDGDNIHISTADEAEPRKEVNVLDSRARISHFEVYSSDQSQTSPAIESIATEIKNELEDALASDTSTNIIEQLSNMLGSPYNGDEQPWELDDSDEENGSNDSKNVTSNHDKSESFFIETPQLAMASTSVPTVDESENEESEKENYDDYFSQNKPVETKQGQSPKTVRFDENKLEKVNIITPKDSLEASTESDTPGDTNDEEEDEEETVKTLQQVSNRITDYMDDDQRNNNKIDENRINGITSPSKVEIPLSKSNLPPPLPSLPPVNSKKKTDPNEDISSNLTVTSSQSPILNTDIKRRQKSPSESDSSPIIQATIDTRLHGNSNDQLTKSLHLEFEESVRSNIKATIETNLNNDE